MKQFRLTNHIIGWVLLILLSPVMAYAQQVTDSVYLDKGFAQVPDKSKAAYVRYTTFDSPAKEAGINKIFFITGEKFAEYVINSKQVKSTGYNREWHQNGQLKYEQQIESGVPVGVRKDWYDKGQLFYTFSYVDGLPHGEAFTYYATGARKRVEVFEKGQIMEGRCFTKTGQDTAFFPHEKMPEYPGGLGKLYQYLGTHVVYPKKALKRNVQGVVVLQFVVSKTGQIDNVDVVRPVHPDLDKEAIRVVSGMPTWQPGQQEGVFKNVRYTLPIAFKFE